MSETPRVDAVAKNYTIFIGDSTYTHRDMVDVDLARSLERELAEARAKLREAQSRLEIAEASLIELRDKHNEWPMADALRIEGDKCPSTGVPEKGILPCPFCGNDDIDPEGWASTHDVGPSCKGCGASAESVKLWNKRTCQNTGVPREFCTCHLCKGK
jgi:hypothetical protein